MGKFKAQECLKMPVDSTTAINKRASAIRFAIIDEALSWEGVEEKNKYRYHEIWKSEDGKYAIALGKYGKEFYLNNLRRKDGSVGNNPNDMRPTIFEDKEVFPIDGSFTQIFDMFQKIHAKKESALEVLGALLVRNAFVLDHHFVDGRHVYIPPSNAVHLLRKDIPDIDGLDIEVFLHYLEAIAINEDVKYYTLQHDITKGAGRKNNLLTCAHIIAVFVGKASLVKLLGNFTRPPVGVAPLSLKIAKEAFDYLR